MIRSPLRGLAAFLTTGVGCAAAVVVLSCAGIGAYLIVHTVTTAATAVTGAQDEQAANNDGVNHATAEARFNQLANQISAYQAQIGDDTADGDTVDVRAVEAVCRDAISQYDAASVDPLQRDWRPAGLPLSVPMSACAPNAPAAFPQPAPTS